MGDGPWNLFSEEKEGTKKPLSFQLSASSLLNYKIIEIKLKPYNCIPESKVVYDFSV